MALRQSEGRELAARAAVPLHRRSSTRVIGDLPSRSAAVEQRCEQKDGGGDAASWGRARRIAMFGAATGVAWPVGLIRRTTVKGKQVVGWHRGKGAEVLHIGAPCSFQRAQDNRGDRTRRGRLADAIPVTPHPWWAEYAAAGRRKATTKKIRWIGKTSQDAIDLLRDSRTPFC